MHMAPARAPADPRPLSWVAADADADADRRERRLLLLLHGAEDEPADILAWTDALDPSGRYRSYAAEAPCGAAGGSTWFSSTPRGPDGDEVRASVTRLQVTIAHLRGRVGISAEPAAVLGFSQGGAVALLLASDGATDSVEAAVSVCGWLPDVEGWPDEAAVETRSGPTRRVLVVNARDDEVVPVDFGEAAALTLRAADLPVEFLAVDGGHHPERRVLALIGDWLSRLAADEPGT
jgi:predicted esterase